jgi:glutamine amidotransferase
LAKSVSIIACGPTNRLAMRGALSRVGCKVHQISGAADIVAAERIILYGDGLFPDAIARLNRDGLSDAIVRAITNGTPILGINLGMQLLFSGSDQGGRHTGLAVFADRLVRVSGGPRFPHYGWNTVQSINGCPLLKGLDMHSFYFLHDYWALDVTAAHTAGITEFGMDFVSVAHRDNVFGVQFCPEKSGEDGLKLLSNFMEIPVAKEE